MKIFKLIYVLLFGILSCGQNPASTPSEKLAMPLEQTSEEWTLYNMRESIVHVQRLLSGDSGLTLLSYDINIAEPEAALQTFISRKQHLSKSEAEQLRLRGSKPSLDQGKTIRTLFVQISATEFKDDWEELLKRQAVEKEIGDALKKDKLGEWVAGDLGPGGANMLFEVNNINRSIPIILNILGTSGFNKNIRIGRRITTTVDDWFYEILYPLNFTGKFITM